MGNIFFFFLLFSRIISYEGEPLTSNSVIKAHLIRGSCYHDNTEGANSVLWKTTKLMPAASSQKSSSASSRPSPSKARPCFSGTPIPTARAGRSFQAHRTASWAASSKRNLWQMGSEDCMTFLASHIHILHTLISLRTYFFSVSHFPFVFWNGWSMCSPAPNDKHFIRTF